MTGTAWIDVSGHRRQPFSHYMKPEHFFQPALSRALLLFGSLLAPALYLVVCALISCLIAFPISLVTGDSLGFHTLVSRGALAILVLGLVLIGRNVGLARGEFGITAGNREFFWAFRCAFAAGTLMLLLHFALLIWLGARGIAPGELDYVRLLRLACKGLLIGLAVGVFEESVFRGFLLGSLLRRLPRELAITATSLYFAALHFVRSDLRFAPDQIEWSSSFVFAADSFSNLSRMQADSFLALFTAGVFLSYVRLVLPNGLAWCVGIHAGWVFVIKSVKPFTYANHQSDWFFLMSRFDGVIGYLSAAWVTILTVILVRQNWRSLTIGFSR